MENEEKRKDAFYRKFVSIVSTNLKNNNVLAKLWSRNVLTSEEWHDEIVDFSTYARRLRFWEIMQTKDYVHVATFIQIWEEEDLGNANTVHELRQYLQETDPQLAKTLRSRGVPSELRPPMQIMPNLAHNFVERKTVLQDLHEKVTRPSAHSSSSYALLTSVHGLGGIGKTTLARRYADYFCERHPGSGVYWIQAESRSTLTIAFRNLGNYFRILDSTEILKMVQQVYIYARGTTCLFVFDNVSEYDGTNGIIDFLPTPYQDPNHFILATSRRKDLVGTDKVVQLGVLEESESVELIAKQLPNSTMEARQELCNLLGSLPLALQQAVAYIVNYKDVHKDQTDAIRTYIQDFNRNSRKLLLSDVYNEDGRKIEKTLYLTWTTTLSTISKCKNGNLAHLLLRCLSYINPDSIDISFVAELDLRFDKFPMIVANLVHFIIPRTKPISTKHDRGFKSWWTYQEQLKSALLILSQYSMITMHAGKIGVHRLVQEVVRHQTKNSFVDEETLIERIIACMENSSKVMGNDQIVLHGLAILPFYKNYSWLQAIHPRFPDLVLADKKLVDLILTELCSHQIKYAWALCVGLKRSEPAIRRAIKCIKLLKRQSPFESYVKTMVEITGHEKYSWPTSKTPTPFFNWINVIDDVQGTTAETILRCLPFLNTEHTSSEFLSFCLNIPESEIQLGLAQLNVYGIIRVKNSIIVNAFIDVVKNNQEMIVPLYKDHLALVLKGLTKAYDARNFIGECMKHIDALHRVHAEWDEVKSLKKNLFPKLEELDDIEHAELYSFILKRSPGVDVKMAAEIAEKYEYNKDVIAFIPNFFESLDDDYERTDSLYYSALKITQHFNLDWVKQLSIWCRVTYVCWYSTTKLHVAASVQMKLLIDIVLLLDDSEIDLMFIAGFWPGTEMELMDAAGWLFDNELPTRNGKKLIGKDVVMLFRQEPFYLQNVYSTNTLSIVVRYICEQLESHKHKRQCILHGYHILRRLGNDSQDLGCLASKMSKYEPILDDIIKNKSCSNANEAITVLGW